MEKLRNLKYFSKVPNIHAPMNQKHVKCNQPPFKNNQLRKAIMTRTRFLNKYGNIIVPEIYLPVKDREMLLLGF